MAYTPGLQMFCLQSSYKYNMRAETDQCQRRFFNGVNECRIAAFLGPGLLPTLQAVRLGLIAMCCAAIALMFCSNVPAAAAANLDDGPPSDRGRQIDFAEAAFEIARRWLDEFETPSMSSDASRIALPDTSAVCVTLRRFGRVMGVGVDDAGDDLMMRRAMGRAMNQTLSDPALQSISKSIRRDAVDADDLEPDARDAIADERIKQLRRDLGRAMTLQIELAGERTPLIGASLDSAATKIEPGVDGVSMRRQQTWSHLFPSQLRSTDLAGDPVKTLTSVAVNAGVALAEVDRIFRDPDCSLYVFRSIDFAQVRPDAPPKQLFRGERLVPRDSVTRASVEQLAAGIVDHLLSRRFPEPPANHPRLPLGFLGDYSPASDRYEPQIAPPLEQALCALALARAAGAMPDNHPTAAKASLAAVQTLRDLAIVHAGEVAVSDDPGACAAVIMAAIEMPSTLSDDHIGPLVREGLAATLKCFDPASGFHDGPIAGDGGMVASPIERAMIVSAWAQLLNFAAESISKPAPELVRIAIDDTFGASDDADRISLLPWLGWAERDYAAAMHVELANLERLQRLAEAVERVRVPDAGDVPPDLCGGLSVGGSGSVRGRPTSQTIRPAIWMASIANDPRITPPTRQPSRWAGHLDSMRFIAQLAVSDLRAATLRQPARAVGGICAAPWDVDQPLAAQAMGLLAIAETLRVWPELQEDVAD